MIEATSTLQDALSLAVYELESVGIDTASLDAELLFVEVLSVDRSYLRAHPEAELDPEQARSFADLIERRRRREPVAYILGEAHFRALKLAVDHRVLIPRPETELLVDLAGDGQRVLDVGTGSGAIAIAIASERIGATVTGIDNSPGAVEVARENARRTGVAVEFMIADLIVGGPYDLIVSNPPYVRDADWQTLQPEITLYEPEEALLAGDDGLDVIRELVPAAAGVLRKGGTLGIEVGQGQSRDVEALFERAGLKGVETKRDLAGIPRVVTGRR